MLSKGVGRSSQVPCVERSMMRVEPVCCPHCEGVEVAAYGKTTTGKQRFRCQNEQCEKQTFLRVYSYPGCLPAVKRQIVEMTLNGSGVRDIRGACRSVPLRAYRN